MGTLAFLSIGVGALVFGSCTDKIGRKKSIMFATGMTPILQLILLGWIPGVGPLSVMKIYFTTVLMGLSYSLRGSANYLYATESLLDPQQQLNFGVKMFFADGCLTICTAFLFWSHLLTWRIYYSISLVTIATSVIFFIWVMPESPVYLHAKEEYAQLKVCLGQIAKLNGTYNPDRVNEMID